ncbi:hypothetical protein [Bacillus sp. NPDC094106]|uniref:hypothetical protein n=1 Tax=Bacillus sp. NPDC094106 TaxID=3363949 RepID=UPI00382E5BFB
MAKANKLSAIEQVEHELREVQDKIDDNAQKYRDCWKKRNEYLEIGEPSKASDCEGKYYYLRDTVGKKLDNERILAANKMDELLAGATQIKRSIKKLMNSQEYHTKELNELKKRYYLSEDVQDFYALIPEDTEACLNARVGLIEIHGLLAKQQEIKEFEDEISGLQQRLVELEGDN